MAASGVIVITCGLFMAFIVGTFVHYKVRTFFLGVEMENLSPPLYIIIIH